MKKSLSFLLITAQKLFLFLPFLLLLFLFPSLGEAGVTVAPGRISIDQPVKAGSTIELPTYTITNRSGIAIDVIVKVSDHGSDKRTEPLEEWFSFSPKHLAIDAGEKREVKIILSLPPDATPGSYSIWFDFLAKPKGVSGFVNNLSIQPSFTFDIQEIAPPLLVTSQSRPCIIEKVTFFTYNPRVMIMPVALQLAGGRFGWQGF
ncbi:hypothetical protein F9B85_11445 [Heliorestis acidaminivorans]|uniref:Uncharacterized protein n=1 Tax=Heliorestis acidaminivorans TaxID=553427 RepID=A0A6I0ES65_9FIRM|nr:hypothetical protein [Heliorestis acidaminivorans]KAB2951641.1 hypothetical protein F9B85_11445 [Heliorestis acidaminivorans]